MEMTRYIPVLLILVLLTVATPTSGRYDNNGDQLNLFEVLFGQNGGSTSPTKRRESNNQGQFVQCNKEDPPFLLTWSPKEITEGQTVLLNLEFTPPVDVNSGYLETSLWLPGFDYPLLTYSKPFNCGFINNYYPGLCPLRRGKTVRIYNHPWQVKGLPTLGSCFLRIRILNEKRQLVICMQGTVDIKSFSDYDDYFYSF